MIKTKTRLLLLDLCTDTDCTVARQAKLNCEVLAPGIGLELRWSLAGESAVLLQIVGNLGSEMYMVGDGKIPGEYFYDTQNV